LDLLSWSPFRLPSTSGAVLVLGNARLMHCKSSRPVPNILD
jgi:hypothetical protein